MVVLASGPADLWLDSPVRDRGNPGLLGLVSGLYGSA
jgi:hypothetical protein